MQPCCRNLRGKRCDCRFLRDKLRASWNQETLWEGRVPGDREAPERVQGALR